jgi:hypothetical protein
MNGHELGSWSLSEFQSYCGHFQVPGSISEKACAVDPTTTNAAIKMSEAKTRRIVGSWD